MEALQQAVKLAGSQRALAEIIGGGQTRVSEMFRRGAVPAEAVIAVAKAVSFQVTPHELRPDLYPHPDDGLPLEMRGERLVHSDRDDPAGMATVPTAQLALALPQVAE